MNTAPPALASAIASLQTALPYLQRHAGQIFVIKYGGHALADTASLANFAADCALLRQFGILPVVVHGGGPQIDALLTRLNIPKNFVAGRRVTDAATLEVAEMVLAGSLNKQIVRALLAAGASAVGLSGQDAGLLQATPLQLAGAPPLGLVGTPSQVQPALLHTLLQAGQVPVVAPLALGPHGEALNVNADTAAGAIAAALGASRFYLLTDVAGVWDEKRQIIPELRVAAVARLLAEGVIAGGMIPKVETCVQAVQAGVGGAVILDGRVPHIILQELLAQEGAGTLVVA